MEVIDKLRKLLRVECHLTDDDIFQSKHFTIITRRGIEKIQYAHGIQVTFQVEKLEPDFVVVKATGHRRGDNVEATIETFGEFHPTHIKKSGGRDIPYYPVAMAEKRALSRVVLKLVRLYEHDVIGEDETVYDEADVPASMGQKTMIESLLNTSTYGPEQSDAIEKELSSDMTYERASFWIGRLEINQQDPMDGNYSQKDINKKLDDHVH